MDVKLDKRDEEISKLRSALEFYADEKNYILKHQPGFNVDFSKEPPEVIDTKEWGVYTSVAGEDAGQKARDALGDEK